MVWATLSRMYKGRAWLAGRSPPAAIKGGGRWRKGGGAGSQAQGVGSGLELFNLQRGLAGPADRGGSIVDWEE